MTHLNKSLDTARTVLGGVESVAYTGTHDVHAGPLRGPAPFITISRQAGAGGHSLAQALVRRLNEVDPGDRPWTCWDNELLERVATRYNLAPDALEAYEDQTQSWLKEFFNGLSQGDSAHPDELVVHHRVGRSIRELARIGRCVIVGRGGVAVTADMPGGIHVRVVAPVAHRVKATAALRGISQDRAAEWVTRTDHARQAFQDRYWPPQQFAPERFAITLNAAAGAFDQLADCILPLVQKAAVPV